MGGTGSTLPADDTDKYTHFPTRDLQEWLNAFRREFSNGQMTCRDLEAIFREFFPFGSPQNFSRRLFETINISQSGTVDFNELLIAFSILTKGSSHEKLRWTFRFYDRDNDGVISKAEMVEVAQYLLEMTACTVDIEFDPRMAIEEIFVSLNNTKGYLTYDDLKDLSETNEKAFKMLAVFVD
jgi:neuronal calcium sensor 1